MAVARVGRPKGSGLLYTDELADVICRRLEEGEGLIGICRTKGMPAESTVRLWATENHNGFAAKYARARDLGQEHQVEALIAIADNGKLSPEDRKVRIETRKWILSKLAPKKWGDRLDHHVDATVRYVIVGETESADSASWAKIHSKS